MIDRTQDEIYKTFAAVSGNEGADLGDVVKSLSDVVGEIQSAQSGQNRQAPGIGAGTADSGANGEDGLLIGVQPAASTVLQAMGNTPTTDGSGASGVLDTVESVASTVLKSGFGILPLVGELFGLFGGGDSSAPAPLVKYAMPTKLNFEGADSGSGLSNADYDQSGLPRAYTTNSSGNTETQGNATPTPQITVNVQAMDARSFLDRSNDIAAAVRDAMLNLSSINDVINDL